MLSRGSSYLVIRLIAVMCFLYIYFSNALIPPLLLVSIIIGSYALYKIRGLHSMISYMAGLSFIALIILITSNIYGVQFHSLINYLYIYSFIIPITTTISLSEIIVFTRIEKLRFILYLLIVLRMYSLLLERFWRTLEYYRAYYRGKLLIYRYTLRSLLGSLPYVIRSIAEYLYVNIKR